MGNFLDPAPLEKPVHDTLPPSPYPDIQGTHNIYLKALLNIATTSLS